MDENTLRALDNQIQAVENEINEFSRNSCKDVYPENLEHALYLVSNYLSLFQRKEALYRFYYQKLHVEFIKELSSIKQELYRIGQLIK